jgi:hypothetical protein
VRTFAPSFASVSLNALLRGSFSLGKTLISSATKSCDSQPSSPGDTSSRRFLKRLHGNKKVQREAARGTIFAFTPTNGFGILLASHFNRNGRE